MGSMFIRSHRSTAQRVLLAAAASLAFQSSVAVAQLSLTTTMRAAPISLRVGPASTTTSSTGATTTSVPVTWLSYPDATSYVLTHYSDAAGTRMIGSSTFSSQTSTSITPAAGISTYYSRIVARGLGGRLSQSSLVRIDFPIPASSMVWTLMSGAARDVGVGGSGTWIVGTGRATYGNAVWRLVSNTWYEVASEGAARIDVDARGIPWIVDNRGVVQKYGAAWTSVGSGASDIGVGANGTAWIIGNVPDGANFTIYRGIADSKGGMTWTKMEGSAVRVDVDPLGNAWIVNAAGAIYRWDGSRWISVPGVAARDVGIGADGAVFIAGTDDMTYRWNSSTGWDKREGAGISISVDPNGVPMLVNSLGAIYKGWR